MADDEGFGLSDTGFVPKTQEDLRAELDANSREIAPSLPLGDSTWQGHSNGLLSLLFAELWQLAQAAIDSRNPNNATGPSLAATAALTGTTRLPARPSRVLELITGTPGTPINPGFAATTGGTNAVVGNFLPAQPLRRFHTITLATIVAQPAWTVSTVYAVKQRVANAGNCFECITPGASAPSGSGPTGVGQNITDGVAHWKWLGLGAGLIETIMESDDNGPVIAAAGDLSLIATPQAGIGNATNQLDATPGAFEESDGDLRIRRAQELSAAGTGPKDAIRADLLEIGKGTSNPVTSCTVYMNVDDTTDADGVPPHSVECVLIGGDDQAIYDQLLASVSGGIRTYGTSVGTALDSEGHLQPEKFTRPAQVTLYVRVAAEYDATLYPSDGDAQIKAAVEKLSPSAPGRDAVPAKIESQALTVSGVNNADAAVYTDVIGTPVAWTASTAYVATAGSRSVVSNDGGRLYICITAGNSSSLGGPTGVGQNITDGTAHWAFIGAKITVTSRQQAAYAAIRTTVASTAVDP